MLIELGVMQQRHEAVLEVLQGVPVVEVARRYGVTRQSVHRWLRRYAQSGIAGLASASCRPASCPHQMPPAVEARIVEMRLAHPLWGPRTLAYHLAAEGVAPPSRTSIYRCLVRHHLIDPQKRRRRRREDYRRWERERPMELWQMDVMGGVRLADGSELKIVTGIDDHSRYCVCARLTARATARPVCAALREAMACYGIPEQLLTDNGKVFTGRFGRGPGPVLFDRICHEHGVRHLLTAPRSPTTTGKVERFHKTVRREFLRGRIFASQEEAQEALDAWVASYNCERPHQAVGMAPPRTRFAAAPPATAAAAGPAAPEGKQTREARVAALRSVRRRVSAEGRISVSGSSYRVGTHLAGEIVTVQARENGLLDVTLEGVLVASLVRRHAATARPAPRPRRSRPRQETPQAPPAAVQRLVDASGSIRFAGINYYVGARYRGCQVEVRVVGAAVEIAQGGGIIRAHLVRHDRRKEHGALALPGGRPRRHQGDDEEGKRRNTATGANA